MKNRTMQEVVAEYNSLTGQNIKRFATVEVGEKRIALAKASKPVPQSKVKCPIVIKDAKPVKAKAEPHGHKQRITVDGVPHRSVFMAFESLGLPITKHIKFRAKLKASGKETFEHEGKKYHFVNVKQESLV